MKMKNQKEIMALKNLDLIGDYESCGKLQIPLKGKKFTVIFYYNENPDKGIKVDNNLFYVHHTLPAYLIRTKRYSEYYVGTYKEIKNYIKGLNHA